MAAKLEEISAIVCRVGKLESVRPVEDFYAAGFSSVHALDLLLELESACSVSIPDDDFISARTPEALHRLVTRLQSGNGALAAAEG